MIRDYDHEDATLRLNAFARLIPLDFALAPCSTNSSEQDNRTPFIETATFSKDRHIVKDQWKAFQRLKVVQW